MKFRKIVCPLLTVAVVFSMISVILCLPFGASASDSTVLKDGSFETSSSWSDSQGRIKIQDAFNGEYAVKSDSNDKVFSKEFNLEKNICYTVGLWYRNPALDESDAFGITSDFSSDAQSRILDSRADLKAVSDWAYAEFDFTARHNTKYMLALSGKNIEIDCVSICVKTSGNLVENGSFEKGLEGFNNLNNKAEPEIVTDSPADGYTYVKLKNGDNSGLVTEFTVKNNTDYTASFSYIGGGAQAYWAVAESGGILSDDSLITDKIGFESSNEWKTATVGFNSGSADALKLVMCLGNSGELSVDNIEVRLDESKNLLKNGGFEDGLENWSVKGDKPEISSNVNSGDNSLSLPAAVGSTEQTAFQDISVEANTDYIVSFSYIGSNESKWSVGAETAGKTVFDENDSGRLGGGRLGGIGNALDEYSWKTETAYFNSGSAKSVRFAVQNTSGTLTIDDAYIAKSAKTDSKPILDNGDFENGLEGWEKFGADEWVFRAVDNAKRGTNALRIGAANWYPKLCHSFKAEKGKRYVAVFSYKGKPSWLKYSVADRAQAIETSSNGFIVGGVLTAETDEWNMVRTKEFTVNEDKTLYFNMQPSDSNDTEVFIDDIFVYEFDGDSLVLNGECTDNLVPYEYDSECFRIDSDGHNSPGSIAAGGGYYKNLTQLINVKPNTNYEFSFWYKGKMPGFAAWAVSASVSFSDAEVFDKGTLDDAKEWTKVQTVINSSELESLYIVFQTSVDCDYRIDDISFVPTSKQGVVKAEKKHAYFEAEEIGHWYNDKPYITDDKHNVLTNSSFESNTELSAYDGLSLAKGSGSITSDSEYVHSGSNSLKFTAGDERSFASALLKLKKNTRYWLTLFVKSPNLSDTQTANLTFGIAEPDTGDFIRMENLKSESSRNYTTSVQIIPTPDNEWHLRTFSFVTNDVESLSLLISGTNSTAYFDDIYIFEEKYAVTYKAPVKQLKDVSITKESTSLMGVKDESYNLFENFNLSEARDAYWSDTEGTLFGSSLNIVNSKNSIQGNALYYENTTRDYPNRIYYIKWIDVEPKTDYTFSARYVITEMGEGSFGIISGYRGNDELCTATENVLFPTLIKDYDFSVDNFDKNHNFKSVGFTFNTGERNRIGFVVFDGGGSAYIDDLRLFKTEYAVKLSAVKDNFPKSITSANNGISVYGGMVYSKSSDVSVKSIIDKLNNNKYIRIFAADGTEITDFSKRAVTGMEIRLMDGPTVKDRATMIVQGDINCDGFVNGKDVTLLVNHLSTKKLLTGIALKAADMNRDGLITVNDAAYNYQTVSKGSEEFKLEGPKSFNPGDEIEVTLVSAVNNLKSLSGCLKVNSKMLRLTDVSLDVSGNWDISYVDYGDNIRFAAADLSGKAAVGKSRAVITFTFRVGRIKSYSDAAVRLAELFATDGSKLITSPQYTWQAVKQTKKVNKTTGTKIINTYDTIVTQQKVAARNLLSILKLDEAELTPKFDPKVKQYTATVPYEIEKVTVTAVAADPEATVTIGDTNLEYVGKNLVSIKVVSKTGLKRTYKILVTRLDPEGSETLPNESVEIENPQGMPAWLITLICVSAAIIAACIVLVIIILIKKRKSARGDLKVIAEEQPTVSDGDDNTQRDSSENDDCSDK